MLTVPPKRRWVRHAAILGTFALILLVAWSSYSPGFNGTLLFDDRANLDGLTNAHTGTDVLSFIFGGEAGPTGRPLALASFALQRQHWPSDLRPLLKTNVALHLGTGVAVFLFALGLARAIQHSNAEWIALLTSCLWLLSPFLATTPLMLIQRMAVLAGLFIFSGLAAYVWGRIYYNTHPFAGGLLIGFGILLGTSLATLSKENGALLPLLALVTELTLLRHAIPLSSRTVRAFQWVALGLPTALVILYLGMKTPALFEPAGLRSFTLNERFSTQPAILWDYVRHLLIPGVSAVTPFTDDQVASSGWTNPVTILSTGAWIVILASAIALRKRMPIVLFSVLFFLTAHALESSIINLELYFQHRNYVPAFGLYFCLAAAVAYGASLKPRLIVPGVSLYALSFGIVLLSSTSLWGQPRVASEVWATQQPESLRAYEFLANQHLSNGDPYTARRVLQHATQVDASGATNVLALYPCAFAEPHAASASRDVETAASKILHGTHSNSMGKAILELTVRVLDGHCPHLSTSHLVTLIDSASENPVYKTNRGIQAQLLNARALISGSSGNTDSALIHLRNMYGLSRHTNHALVYSGLLMTQGRVEEALEFLELAKEDVPIHPVKRWIKRRTLDDQIDLISSASASSGGRGNSDGNLGTATVLELPAPPR